MKKKLVAVTLPLIAGVALSGTGFGLWVFNETVDPFTVGASMQLEPAIAINSDCLKITGIKVVNANGKSLPGDSTLIFDQSDQNQEDYRWKVTVSVSFTFELIDGILHEESDPTDGLGNYNPATSINAQIHEDIQNRLFDYSVDITNPLATGGKGDPTCKINAYLDKGTSTDTAPNGLGELYGMLIENGHTPVPVDNKITLNMSSDFHFKPKALYNQIQSKDGYETFRGLLSTSTFNFKVELTKF
ncbi:MAG: hypothetical protein MR977_03745 [Bacilli bacterium]|nr:hypothetical protein [Bacilli bacterium]